VDKRSEFNFEQLAVWQRAKEFAKRTIEIIDELDTNRKHFRIIEQLESAVCSIALNIAEGKGRYSKKEFIQFLYYARGSLFEVVTLLIIFHEKQWITDVIFNDLKNEAAEISKMLSGLISSIHK
jgi:four helix bundle protein